MGDKKKSYSSQAIDLDLKIQDGELIENYTDLRVYTLAFDSAIYIFEISKKWPPEEKYSLIDQIRRFSRSVCANIAESWRKRRYPAHFVSKLSNLDSEVAETKQRRPYRTTRPLWSHLPHVNKYDCKSRAMVQASETAKSIIRRSNER